MSSQRAREARTALMQLEARRYRLREVWRDVRVAAAVTAITAVLSVLAWRGSVNQGPVFLFSMLKSAVLFGAAGVAFHEALSHLRRGWMSFWLTLPWPRRLLVKARWRLICRAGFTWAAIVMVFGGAVYLMDAWTSPVVWMLSPSVARLALDTLVTVAASVPVLSAWALTVWLWPGRRAQVIAGVLCAVEFAVVGLAVWGQPLWVMIHGLPWCVRLWILEVILSTLVTAISLALVAHGLHAASSPERETGWITNTTGPRIAARASTVRSPRMALFWLFFARWRAFGPGADRLARRLLSVVWTGVGLIGLALGLGGVPDGWAVASTQLVQAAAWGWMIVAGGLIIQPITDGLVLFLAMPVKRRWLVVMPVLACWTRIALWTVTGVAALTAGCVLGCVLRGNTSDFLAIAPAVIGQLALQVAAIAGAGPLATIIIVGAYLSLIDKNRPLALLPIATMTLFSPGVFFHWTVTNWMAPDAGRRFLLETVVILGLALLCEWTLRLVDTSLGTAHWGWLYRRGERSGAPGRS